MHYNTVLIFLKTNCFINVSMRIIYCTVRNYRILKFKDVKKLVYTETKKPNLQLLNIKILLRNQIASRIHIGIRFKLHKKKQLL